MIVKIWSLDKTIKKLAVVATFDALKKKAIEFGICCNGDIKVHMLDGTEVDEEAFNCLNQSPEDATYTFIATTYSWVSGVCLDGKLSLPKDVLLLVTFLRSSPKNDAALEWSLKINKAEAEFKDQNAAAVCLLPLLASYFQENLGELFQLHQVTTEITEEFRNSLPASPVIVALGRSLF
ncbi:uncharacterized protein LOC121834526 [Ixodes scapularis]|nr:uncharacterized protein LOC121834506 [Ixodes scapularis]XP_042144159.1 uncharacterized protein LOC121834526 [Ixodes scapularis]